MPVSTASPAADPVPTQELLETLLTVSLTGISLLSPRYSPSGALEDFALEYLNPAAQRMTGLPERPGGTLCAHFPHARTGGILDFCRHAYETGETGRNDFHDQAGGLGNYFHVAARRSGRQLVVSFTDTAEHRRPAEASREAAGPAAAGGPAREPETCYQVFEQTPAGIVLLRGPEHRIAYCNEAYQRLFPGRRMRGRTIAETQPGAARQGFVALLDGVYHSGETYFGRELQLDIGQPDGTRKEAYFNFTYQAYRENDRIAGVSGLAYEVTEQVRARQRVQQLNQELQAANQELSETNAQLTRTNADLDNFIYTASHDLKAPILNIEGLMKVLSRKVDPSRQQDETVQKVFSMIEAAVRRFKETITDLTDIARIEKQMNSGREQVDLPEIVRDTLLDLQPQVRESGAVIGQDLKACPTILFPRKNLKSVVYNLLSNALKYRDPRRTPYITLTCHREGDHHVLLVRDNGLGMDASNPEKIFGMFKRQHAHVEGAGIGLYIVRKMVENAGGKIEVESKVGEGSTFRVYFKR